MSVRDELGIKYMATSDHAKEMQGVLLDLFPLFVSSSGSRLNKRATLFYLFSAVAKLLVSARDSGHQVAERFFVDQLHTLPGPSIDTLKTLLHNLPPDFEWHLTTKILMSTVLSLC